MRCEPVVTNHKRIAEETSAKHSTASRLSILALLFAAIGLAVACGSGGNGVANPPPPQVAPEWFFVGNGSGNVTGFSALSGRLEPIPGSSVNFPLIFPDLLTNFEVEPKGTFLTAIIGTTQSTANFQIANIASGGAISLTPLTTGVNNPGGMAISSQGVIAVTNVFSGTVQLMMYQNNLLFQGPSAATGPLPQDAVFSPDGSRLYVGNNAGGTISVFSLSSLGSTIQLLQTAQLPVAAGEFAPNIVRVALSRSGKKFAATTFDGKLFVGDVSATDGTLSGFTETHVAPAANLEEVVFDPAEKNIYAADQDNGGIFGFSVTGTTVTPLSGSPFSTGTLPGGPTGMAFNSAGDRLYVVMGAQSAVFTYSHDSNSGGLSATGDVVGTGGFFAGRIVRVPAH